MADIIRGAFSLPEDGWTVWVNREKTEELKHSNANTLGSLKFRHGDMLYLDLQPQITAALEDNLEENGSKDKQLSLAAAGALLTGDSDDAARALDRDLSGSIVEDEVDQFLWKQDGTIPREKNEQLCRHGSGMKCVTCVPFQPYDNEYLVKVTPPIKFLSFHSYLRKLTRGSGGMDKGKLFELENPSFRITRCSRAHPTVARSRCLGCIPSAFTLQRQKYRHVDFIQFENHLMVERFLDYWRKTGNQRLGFLYGRYEYHKDVPLGIKAVVSAIYEPLQVSTKSSIELVQDEDEVVNSIAAKLGLRKVGWIFTDLVPLDTSTGSDDHFTDHNNGRHLSAEECIIAADLQNRHPNPCKLSSEGHFGSKFVTVVVTGDSQKQIHFDGYQVSNQCMALIRDDCLVPTKDASELGYVKESTKEQYVPDVFYKATDRYGNEVTQLARPLPVDCLLVDLAVAFPKELAFTFFASADIRPFSIEHREGIGETQEFTGFAEYIRQFKGDRPMNVFNDLHILTYLASCDMLPIMSKMDELLQALKTKDETLFQQWLQSEEWATVELLLAQQKLLNVAKSQCDEEQKGKAKNKIYQISDLPPEVIHKILMKAIVETITQELVNPMLWLSRFDIHKKSLGNVSTVWMDIMETPYFQQEIEQQLGKRTPKPVRMRFVKKTELPACVVSVCYLKGEFILLIKHLNNTYCLKFFSRYSMKKCLRNVNLSLVAQPVEIEACVVTCNIYILCEGVMVLKVDRDDAGVKESVHVIIDSDTLQCTFNLNTEGNIVMLSTVENQRLVIFSTSGLVERTVSIPQGLEITEVLCEKNDRFILVCVEKYYRKYIQVDATGDEIQSRCCSCTDSLSQTLDHLDRLCVFGTSVVGEITESCRTVFDYDLEEMDVQVTGHHRYALNGYFRVKCVRASNELFMYSFGGNEPSFLSLAKLS